MAKAPTDRKGISMSKRLPAFFRWTFAVLTALMVIAAVAVVAVMVIDPKIATGGTFSANVGFGAEPGRLMLVAGNGATKLWITQATASVTGASDDGLVRLLKHYGLPLALLYTVFFAVLFDLLRRLFRNVQKGDSFTRETSRLVRIVGFALLAFSLVSAAVETLFSMAVLDYLHAHLTGPGLIWVEAPKNSITASLDSSVFFAGLLVLALSEVFRQGLKLKTDNELTI